MCLKDAMCFKKLVLFLTSIVLLNEVLILTQTDSGHIYCLSSHLLHLCFWPKYLSVNKLLASLTR